jgi:putative glutamine amidotransferase
VIPVSRPVIGLCTTLARARWSHWDQEAALVPRSYVVAIRRAGGLAVMIPPDAVVQDDPDEVLDLVDGLVLAGGVDIDPAAYGEERHPETDRPVPERDGAEIALARRALERDIPLLGICRGMQLMNVATGGTLHQHLPEAFGHHEHRRTRGSFDDADHDVRLEPGSLAARAAGEELHATKSHHHQGVDRLGEGIVVTGWSTLDDLPEAIELPDRRFALGVQWHPEVDERSRLLFALVEEARARRAEESLTRRSADLG